MDEMVMDTVNVSDATLDTQELPEVEAVDAVLTQDNDGNVTAFILGTLTGAAVTTIVVLFPRAARKIKGFVDRKLTVRKNRKMARILGRAVRKGVEEIKEEDYEEDTSYYPDDEEE